MNQLDVILDQITANKNQVVSLQSHIKFLYEKLGDGISESNGIITKEIEGIYREIDSTFIKKSQFEQSVLSLKQQIFKELGI